RRDGGTIDDAGAAVRGRLVLDPRPPQRDVGCGPQRDNGAEGGINAGRPLGQRARRQVGVRRIEQADLRRRFAVQVRQRRCRGNLDAEPLGGGVVGDDLEGEVTLDLVGRELGGEGACATVLVLDDGRFFLQLRGVVLAVDNEGLLRDDATHPAAYLEDVLATNARLVRVQFEEGDARKV